jgi:flavoprotein
MLSDKTTIGQIKPTMSIIFTCNVCKTRQAKTMSKKSYEKGVVLIRCDGCENLHLIADNLGWFRDNRTNIVDILKEKEEEVQTLSGVDLLDLTDLGLLKGAPRDDGT